MSTKLLSVITTAVNITATPITTEADTARAGSEWTVGPVFLPGGFGDRLT